jgi:aldose 1-epimerase
MTQAFDDFFRACVVFNPPHRQAICIEPYSCIPNAYALAERGIDAGLRVLAPGESVATRFTLGLS